MLYRREFFGSLAGLAAIGTTACLAREIFAGNVLDEVLKWPSMVIETLPNNDAYRAPVITRVNVQPTGQLISVVGDDHVISLYDQKESAFVEHIKRHKDWVRSCLFSPDGTKLATAGNDRMLFMWQVGKWDDPISIRRHESAIFDLAFSPDGLYLATVGFEEKLLIYDVQTGQVQKELPCPCPDMHAVAFSQDGKYLAAGGRCGTVRVWNKQDWTQAVQFRAHSKRIRSIEFASNNLVVSASDDQFVRITDLNSPTEPRTLPRHPSKLYATALLGQDMLATAGSDNLIYIWRLSSLEKIGVLKGHSGTVSCLSQHDGQLVSGSYDTHVRLWKISATAQERTTDRGWNPSFK